MSKRLTTLTCSSILILSLSLFGCDNDTTNESVGFEHHLERASSYYELGQFQSAVSEAKGAIQKQPLDPRGHIALASVYNKLGQGSIAINILERSFEGKDSDEYLLALGNAYFIKGKTRSLAKLLEEHPELASTQPEAYYSLAVKNAMRLNNDELVGELVQKFMDEVPDSVDAKLLYSDYLLSNNDDSGAAILDELVKEHANNPRVLFAKAKLAYESNDLSTTEKLLNDALSVMPKTDKMTPLNAETLRTLSNLLIKQNRTSEALIYKKALSEAFPGSNDIENKYENAILAYKKNDINEAKKQLLDLLNEYPRHEPSRQLLGIISYTQGDLTKASEMFNTLDPETANAATKQAYALTNMKLNRPEKVLALLKNDIKNTENPDLLTLYGTAAINSPEALEKGVDALKRALAIAPDRARIYLLLNRHYNRMGDVSQATDYIKQGLAISPNDPYLQSAAIRQYVAIDQKDKAIELVEQFTKAQPNELSTNLMAGDFYLSTQMPDKALSYYLIAAQIAPDDASPLIGNYRAQVQLEQWEQAKASAEELINAFPTKQVGYNSLLSFYQQQNRLEDGLLALNDLDQAYGFATIATHYGQMGEFDKAYRYFTQAIEKAPDDNDIKTLGKNITFANIQSHIQNGNTDDARAELIDALDATPDDLRLLVMNTQLEIQSERFDQARQVVQSIRDIDPIVASELEGDLLVAKGDDQGARNLYYDAWQKRPTDSLGIKIYRILKRSGNSSSSDAFVNRWLKTNPDSTTAMNIHSSQLLANHKYEEAIPTLETLVFKNPNSAIALNNLAWAYLQTKDNAALAINAASKAYKLAPDNADVADTYGWILFQQGDTEKAVGILEQAYALDPERKEIKEHLDTARKALK